MKQSVKQINKQWVGTCVVGGGSSTRRGRSTRKGHTSEPDGGSSEDDPEGDDAELEGASEEGIGEEIEEDSEGEEVDYEANAILDKRGNTETSEFEYLIDWIHFNDDRNTWDPAESLPGCSEVLDEFEDDAVDFRLCL